MNVAHDKHWPTRVSDLAMAKVIIDQHAHKQNGQLCLLDECTFNTEDESVRFKLPPWVEALGDAFRSLYGDVQYSYVLSNVMQCLGSPQQ